jgi:hypothetical protein
MNGSLLPVCKRQREAWTVTPILRMPADCREGLRLIVPWTDEAIIWLQRAIERSATGA